MNHDLINRFKSIIKQNPDVELDNYQRFSEIQQLLKFLNRFCRKAESQKIITALENKMQENTDFDKDFLIQKQSTKLKKSAFLLCMCVSKDFKVLKVAINWTMPQFELLNNKIQGKRHEIDAIKKLLSFKELEVMRFLAMGKKRNQIAELMYISVYIYDNHRRSIKKKLNQQQFVDILGSLKDSMSGLGGN
ncbi:MAG: response regulator transcription factor [Bacteroidia bacterium]